MLSLLAPKCFFLYVFTWKIPLSSVQMSKKKKLIFTPLQRIWRRDALISEHLSESLLLWVIVRPCCNEWGCTWRMFNAKTSHCLWRVKRRWGPDLPVHQDLPHTGISRGEFTKITNKINSNYNIFQHLLILKKKNLKHEIKGLNSASWSANGPFQGYSDVLLLGNNSHNHVIEKKKKR